MAPEAAAQVAEHSGEEALTPKELEVLRLIAAGNANKEIGAHLDSGRIGQEPRKEHP